MDDGDYHRIAELMRRRAQRGISYGKPRDQRYIDSCRRAVEGTVLILTREAGYHTGGWWKNPDYERCWHLSMSAVPGRLWTPHIVEHSRVVEETWVYAVFQPHQHLLWFESAVSPEGRARGVTHYRLFMAPDWKTPILPRGEVYSRQFTERGWKSFSELVDAAEACR